ncbi:hypothetical protein [Marinigracilibium pacificum]|uniref:Lipoprotein n=1 Tax=Marinigracilibium pacificum TaxID=2729599 RepID=A0A848IT89_9BACT|nr:hypothetical protein [Marinigracilibium pacificum]NMM47683.1 hypothetical protein [Marinigracilibium pacificum]
MKNLMTLVILAIIISACNSTSESTQNEINEKSDSIQTKTAQLVTDPNPETIDEEINEEQIEESDCIFDQSNQTDEFLKDIDALADYSWNSKTKTATIIMDLNDTLLIKRGGCDHFGVSAEFRIQNKQIDYNDWNNVFIKVLWIAEVLNTQFLYENIKNDIVLSKIDIDGDVAYFSDELLVNNNYEIYRETGDGITTIILSYYIN